MFSTSSEAIIPRSFLSWFDDHTQKLAKYARAGVPVYWVVDAEDGQVSAYTRLNAHEGYDLREICCPGQILDVVIGGHHCGTVSVAAIFPPEALP